jgi:hypothetical protein
VQRYGPPPSYPNLKIPGLNAPIPPGASFGYHAGGWGKPPVDAAGNPIYGDVFGLTQVRSAYIAEAVMLHVSRWFVSMFDQHVVLDWAVNPIYGDVSGLAQVRRA